jgi:hypothetical protein
LNNPSSWQNCLEACDLQLRNTIQKVADEFAQHGRAAERRTVPFGKKNNASSHRALSTGRQMLESVMVNWLPDPPLLSLPVLSSNLTSPAKRVIGATPPSKVNLKSSRRDVVSVGILDMYVATTAEAPGGTWTSILIAS